MAAFYSIYRGLRRFRAQDLVWILLFVALALTVPQQYRDGFMLAPLSLLAVMQVLEPKIPALASARGRILWIATKLGLAYVLIGFTGSINSNCWLVLLFPVLTAASVLGVVGTLAFSLVASGAYASFVLFLPSIEQAGVLPRNFDWSVVWLRVIFLAMVGNLANALAEDLRIQSKKHRRTAEQLAEANQQLQQAEEAVRRSDRMAALGQLSAGLAHELRNPLGAIRASAEMLGRTVSAENEIAREVAGIIAAETDRTNSLVTRFLQFARPLELRLEKADLAQTLDRAIAMVEREAPGISIYKNYDPGIPPFPLDSELMERVIYNLALNAAQASPAGGAVTVKSRAAGSVAEIAVIDRGSGIERRQLSNIFNPFFTTKPQGVGLGLAIVFKIVDEHGGKITVESEPGKGSIFRVLLPMQRSAGD